MKVGQSSASQTDGTLKVSSSNQTPQVLVRNAGIQADLQRECSSEEVTEIINQFTEKIEQMQELHAAEILDMESRHISEAETLKRDHYVAIQLLTEECSTLKAVIQCLRSKEVFGLHSVFFQHSVVGFFFPLQNVMLLRDKFGGNFFLIIKLQFKIFLLCTVK